MLYQAPFLYSWDSVSFALSIERFDMRLHQPHPPGYILYSYALRLLNYFVGDPNKSMIYLNITATLGACFFIAKTVHLLTKNGIAAAGAAAFYATNPVAWFYGSIAEIYAVEGFWVALIGFLVLASHERPRYLIWASGAMALAGGFRPTTEVFLLPFFATGFFRKTSYTILAALFVLLMGNLLWLWPLVSSVGGVSEYIAAVRGQSQRAADFTSEAAEQMTWQKVVIRMIQTVTLPVFVALLFRFRKIRLSVKHLSLLPAVVPPIILFSIIHFPKDGYLLLVIPLLISFCILLLHTACASSRKMTAVITLSCVISVIGFVWPIPASGIASEFTRPNQHLIATRMQRLKRFFEVVDGLGGGRHKTFVLENRHYFPNWRMLLYYYPNDTIYLVWPNKKRAYAANDHKYKTILPPLRVLHGSVLVAVGRTAPSFGWQSFQVDSFRYYFCEASVLPQQFQLYSMRFMVSSNE